MQLVKGLNTINYKFFSFLWAHTHIIEIVQFVSWTNKPQSSWADYLKSSYNLSQLWKYKKNPNLWIWYLELIWAPVYDPSIPYSYINDKHQDIYLSILNLHRFNTSKQPQPPPPPHPRFFCIAAKGLGPTIAPTQMGRKPIHTRKVPTHKRKVLTQVEHDSISSNRILDSWVRYEIANKKY